VKFVKTKISKGLQGATGVVELERVLSGDDSDRIGQTVSLDKETQLFHKFLSGDDLAFRALYDAFEHSLYVYCCRLMASDDDAKDVFQEIWVRMYRMRDEQIEVRRFSGLLFTVARNYCLNALRDSKVLSYTSYEEAGEESDEFFRTRDIESADMRELIQKALAHLPLHQRESFVLREYVGYSYDEIAEIMGTNAANVRARAHRARERLRKVIGAWLELKEKDK
jgi:RNA polymerase sigma-70 factor (ECF subfamily)